MRLSDIAVNSLFFVTLAGCATTKPPEPEIRTVRVSVEVPTPCPKTFQPKPSDAPTRAQILAATPEDRTLLLGRYFALTDVWANGIVDALTACHR